MRKLLKIIKWAIVALQDGSITKKEFEELISILIARKIESDKEE